MVELFFLKRFLLRTIIPYSILIVSVAYIIFELICPKNKKERFYLYSDKLYFKIVRRPLEKLNILLKNSLVSLKAKLKIKIIKRRDKIALKEKKKQKKELEANEKAKLKLNNKINKMNKKANRKEMKKLFFKCLKIKIRRFLKGEKKAKKVN